MVCKLVLQKQCEIHYLMDRIYPAMYKVVCEMEDRTQHESKIKSSHL